MELISSWLSALGVARPGSCWLVTWPSASSLLFPFQRTQGAGRAVPEGRAARVAAAGLFRVRVVNHFVGLSPARRNARRQGKATL